jgi:hypothetical protein
LLEFLIYVVCGVLVIFVALVVGFALWFMIQSRPRRWRAPGFEYVYVDDDGNARELDAEEIEYLGTKFLPGDGARPYIKLRYESLTPDGWMHGYLRRRQLPRRIPVSPAPSPENAL